MSLELEVLDQLEGGDMPLSVLASLFRDEAHALHAIAALVTTGEVCILDPAGTVLAPWQMRELELQPSSWRAATQYQLRLTAAGARRIRG
jgi:hypothetical protein